MQNCRKRFVRFLLESGALTFGDFTLKSGRQSPYMINTGKFDSGAALSRLGCFYAHGIYEQMELGFIPDDINVLFGSPYKGIPIATATAIAMAAGYDRDIGCCFNRKEAKDHGEGGVFVGKKPGAGDRILILDDVMTAGTALRETVTLLANNAPAATIVGAIVAVDRKERGRDARLTAVAELQYELGMPIFSIMDIYEILEMLKSGEYATEGGCGQETHTFCDMECTGPMDADPPTPEQIAAIEKYLEENRPAS